MNWGWRERLSQREMSFGDYLIVALYPVFASNSASGRHLLSSHKNGSKNLWSESSKRDPEMRYCCCLDPCLPCSIGGRQPHKNGNRMETKYRSGVTPHTRNTGVLSQYKRIASLPLSLLVKDSHHPPVQNESPSCFSSRHSGTCCSVYV